MADNGPMKITPSERRKVKKFVEQLADIRGRNTELVSVYVPQGYQLNNIIGHLQEEQSTAQNIKSKQTRENVTGALERMIRHLQLYSKTPPNGLAVFSGNVSEREGQQDIGVWSLEPPVPINQRLYRCDKEFVLEPLQKIAEDRNVYGMIVIDKREANIALLKGKTIIPLHTSTSNVPGKTKAGGQCLNPTTLVQENNGNITPLKNVHNPSLLKGMKDLKDATARVFDVWPNTKKLYKVVTKHPKIDLEASEDHVFFVFENGEVKEKKLKELQQGDSLLLKEKIDVEGEHFEFLPLYYNSYRISKEGREEIRRKRNLMGLYQRELGEEVGVTQTSISTIEKGKRAVNRELLIKILDVLGINHVAFITEKCLPQDNVKPPTTLTPELAQFIGYATGDGHVEKERISLFEQNKEVALHYKRLAEEWEANASVKFRNDKNYYRVRVQGKALSKLLRKEFFEAIGSGKKMPEKVLRSDNKVLASYIKGLFDAEGYVSSHLALGVNNRTLAKQLQFSLLRFGIISSLFSYDNKGNPYSDNTRYTVQISEKESLERFYKEIGFTYLEKRARLNELIKKKSDRSNVRQVLASGRDVRRVIEEHGKNVSFFPKVSNFFRGERLMSKRTFEKSILELTSGELKKELSKFLEREFVPVKIDRIVEKDSAETIDISTTTRNFLAQGILVHNSAQRFRRLREGAAKDFYRRVTEHVKASFLNRKEIKGILLGGPGHTKEEYLSQGQVPEQIKEKVIAKKDLSYTGEFGLEELLESCEDVLAEEEVVEEKKAMKKFLTLLSTDPDMVEYGPEQVMRAIKMGAVDKLLLSEELNDEQIEEFEQEAQKMSTEIMLISDDTREGSQLVDLGKVAALLRFSVSY